MNRREMFTAAGAALVGTGANVKAIEPKPLALVVTFDKEIDSPSPSDVLRIKDKLGKIVPMVKIIVCAPGMNIKAV